mmetsp:Transcript_39283/g.63722  ORF Transcript_39283/g.63722 Transcript_39283/m.63722 type:complete len:519 (+) Transcript_39283:220-1776(+)|eukprot:CAMPEP_0184649800 /NCGR_PEP_ID=MMETSP0308-20130426/7223_1 /TAXON_ID=38269 /ORGANISM="Gloeochaete witrockiana, Strain SAG 46.84" /LENGTH=518 /DNA_ID=CAMNT_0027082809 /DNA_START=157 /DNA_END=1713 /DNA_ORIENTATION=+
MVGSLETKQRALLGCDTIHRQVTLPPGVIVAVQNCTNLTLVGAALGEHLKEGLGLVVRRAIADLYEKPDAREVLKKGDTKRMVKELGSDWLEDAMSSREGYTKAFVIGRVGGWQGEKNDQLWDTETVLLTLERCWGLLHSATEQELETISETAAVVLQWRTYWLNTDVDRFNQEGTTRALDAVKELFSAVGGDSLTRHVRKVDHFRQRVATKAKKWNIDDQEDMKECILGFEQLLREQTYALLPLPEFIQLMFDERVTAIQKKLGLETQLQNVKEADRQNNLITEVLPEYKRIQAPALFPSGVKSVGQLRDRFRTTWWQVPDISLESWQLESWFSAIMASDSQCKDTDPVNEDDSLLRRRFDGVMTVMGVQEVRSLWNERYLHGYLKDDDALLFMESSIKKSMEPVKGTVVMFNLSEIYPGCLIATWRSPEHNSGRDILRITEKGYELDGGGAPELSDSRPLSSESPRPPLLIFPRLLDFASRRSFSMLLCVNGELGPVKTKLKPNASFKLPNRNKGA